MSNVFQRISLTLRRTAEVASILAVVTELLLNIVPSEIVSATVGLRDIFWNISKVASALSSAEAFAEQFFIWYQDGDQEAKKVKDSKFPLLHVNSFLSYHLFRHYQMFGIGNQIFKI